MVAPLHTNFLFIKQPTYPKAMFASPQRNDPDINILLAPILLIYKYTNIYHTDSQYNEGKVNKTS